MKDFEAIMVGDFEVIKVYCGTQVVWEKDVKPSDE